MINIGIVINVKERGFKCVEAHDLFICESLM